VGDRFSRYLLVSHYTESYRAAERVRAMQLALEEGQKLHGELPANQVRLVTDNGSSFTARVFQEFLGRVRVFRHVRVSYRSPELIGLIERFHRTLKEEHLWPAVYETDLQARGELAGCVGSCSQRPVNQAFGYRRPLEVYMGERRPGPGAWAEDGHTGDWVTAAWLTWAAQVV